MAMSKYVDPCLHGVYTLVGTRHTFIINTSRHLFDGDKCYGKKQKWSRIRGLRPPCDRRGRLSHRIAGSGLGFVEKVRF